MDVWGYGSFENEAAVRWVESLEDVHDLELVESTLDDILDLEEEGDIPDPAASSMAIAAAETVAALAEKPSKGLPEEVRQWCFDNPGFDLGEVMPKAVQALGVILQGSGLRDLFEEHGKAEEWEVDLEDLRDRLRV
jgi:hypothetical protein